MDVVEEVDVEEEVDVDVDVDVVDEVDVVEEVDVDVVVDVWMLKTIASQFSHWPFGCNHHRGVFILAISYDPLL